MFKLVREHPAEFLGTQRDDLERIYAVDSKGKRVNIRVIETGDVVSETLIPYPNNAEFEIVEE